jgi:hypothetical protein
VATQSKAWSVFARLNAETVDSNPTQGMDVCIYSVFELSYVGGSLVLGADSPSKVSYWLS